MNNFFNRIIPFIFLGFFIVVFVAGIILLSYLLVIGAIVGIILFCIAWLRAKLFSPKDLTTKNTRKGRIIDHDK